MSRYGSQSGVYVPVIRSSPEVEDIADLLALAAVRNLTELSKSVPFVDMFLAEVSRNGYDNEMFDEVVQFMANMVDASGCSGDDNEIEEIAGQVVLGLSATFVANNPRLEKLLTNQELDVLEDCLAEITNVVRQLERPARQSRGNSRRGGARDRRDNRRDGVDRRAYNGGNNSRYDDDYDDRDRGRRGSSQSPRSRRKANREPLNYRGSESNRNSRSNRDGRQPPAAFESYHDSDDAYDDNHDRLTTKERLRRENQGSNRKQRVAETVVEKRNGNDVPVGRQREAVAASNRSDARPARREEDVQVNGLNDGEQWHEKKDGSRVVIVPVTLHELDKRKSPYRVLPQFPTNTDGYFTINSQGEITGVIGIPKTEEDMDRTRHDTTRFFTTWGDKNRTPDHKATAKALGNLQTKAHIKEIEKEIEAKYSLADSEALPEIDLDKLYVSNSTTTYEAHEDFVSTGRQILLDEVKNDDVKEMFESCIDVVTINYSAISFCGWTIVGDAASKAIELKGLSSFSAIKNKLYELNECIPSSTLHELDVIATSWVNDYVKYNLGIGGWNIDSFMSDIDELVMELARVHSITTAFTSKAPILTSTVLYPMTNRDADVCALTGLSEDGPLTVKFGKMTNITLIQIDSDEFAMCLPDASSAVTRDSWPSLSMALDVVNTLSKPTTAEMLLITKDNRKVHVTQGDTTGTYIVSR